jgi:hypothetical protein
MVLLPNMDEDPTLVAMRKAVEDRDNSKPKRDYLGASTLGHECERFIYYQLYHAEKAEPIEYKGCAAIEDGHRTEQLIKDRLRLVSGIQLWDIDEVTKEQIGFQEGRFGGHVDGIIKGLLQAPTKTHIFEAKACNEKKFNDLKKCIEKFGNKGALKEWDYTFFVQAQIYMGKLSEIYDTVIDRHYLVCSTPGGRDEISCRTEFQPVVYKAMLTKKDRILKAKEPPERAASKPEMFICKWCKFREFCWQDA